MKYSFRKSFNARRRRKEMPEDEQISPRMDGNGCSNSNSNLVNPVKSKNNREREDHSSSSDKKKSKVFEPRHDLPSDEDEHEFENPRPRPLDRLTSQIRKSFRSTLTRQRSRHESPNSDKHLILNKKDENPSQIPILPPAISTGLTSPLPISIETAHTKAAAKRRQAPTKTDQSISPSTEVNPVQAEIFNRSVRTRFSFLQKKRPEENPTNSNLTLTQRFHSLRRSFHIGTRNASNKGTRYLLSNE